MIRPAALAAAALACAVAATPQKAHAASAGCTAANAGAFNLAIGANTLVTPVIAGAFDRGDILTITVAGPAQLAQINLVPSNTSFFSNPAAATTSKTINEDGVAALLISLFSPVGNGASITITCTAAGSGGGAGSSTGNTAAGTSQTADQKSDAAQNTAAAINSVRLPTTPAALPGAGTPLRPQVFTLSTQDRWEALWAEYEAAIRDHYIRNHEEQQQGFVVEEKDIEKFERGIGLYERGEDPPDAGDTLTMRGYVYARDLEAIRDAFRARFDELGVPMSDPQPRAIFEDPSPPDTFETDTPELGDGDIVMFSPDGHVFGFDISTDALRGLARLQLDDNAQAPDLPPLTIAGMPVNIWARGRGTLFDRRGRAGSDGWAAHALAGVTLRINDRVTAGAFGSYLEGESETPLTGTEVESSQGGGGAYARIALDGTLQAGLSLSRETGEQDITSGGASGSADTELFTASASLQGAYSVRPLVLSPSVAVTYSDFERDAYTDSSGTAVPGSRSRDTTISAALTASRSFTYKDGWLRRITPRATATLNYFAREDESLRVSATEVIDLEDWGGNIGAGVTLLTSGNSRISFDAGLIGLGQDTLGYTGQLQVEFGF